MAFILNNMLGKINNAIDSVAASFSSTTKVTMSMLLGMENNGAIDAILRLLGKEGESINYIPGNKLVEYLLAFGII